MRHRLLSLFSAIPLLFLIAFSQDLAQSLQPDNRPRTASLSGRVTIGENPAANALVMLAEVDPRNRDIWSGIDPQQRDFIKVRTDDEGRYRITGLWRGTYLINALSNAYVRSITSADFGNFKSVTLDDGEARADLDLTLYRGGVITGRVVDAEGRPLIAAMMELWPVDKGSQKTVRYQTGDWLMMRTDDRGIYRIYGLPAGRYIIGAGEGWSPVRGKRKYTSTFYPNVTDSSEAKAIEVKEGAEVAGIEIRIGLEDTYEASGRVIDVETGQPLPNVRLNCSSAEHYCKSVVSDDEGRFSFPSLLPGPYELFVENRGPIRFASTSSENSDYYSENTRFTISDADVSGLEVRATRGSAINGNVIIEGVSDPAIIAKLRQMAIIVLISGRNESEQERRSDEIRRVSGAKIASDASFHISGLEPGTAEFELQYGEEDIVSIKRLERDGVEVRSPLEIEPGATINGVRIVLAYNNGRIRGQVEITNGSLPAGRQLVISASPVLESAGDDLTPFIDTRAHCEFPDEKGRFLIENLAAGEYELFLSVMESAEQNSWHGLTQERKRVTVSSGGETQVKITLDLARYHQENRQ